MHPLLASYPGASIGAPAELPEIEEVQCAIGCEPPQDFIDLYREANGFECVVRGGELHVQLFEIAELIENAPARGESLFTIGTDTTGQDFAVALDEPDQPVYRVSSFDGGTRELFAESWSDFYRGLCS